MRVTWCFYRCSALLLPGFQEQDTLLHVICCCFSFIFLILVCLVSPSLYPLFFFSYIFKRQRKNVSVLAFKVEINKTLRVRVPVLFSPSLPLSLFPFLFTSSAFMSSLAPSIPPLRCLSLTLSALHPQFSFSVSPKPFTLSLSL